MEAREQRAVLILADISGYTRYMVANQTAAVHGQWVITTLIETLLREVNIPLVLHGIEGDAVFLSASHPGDDAAWQGVLAQVRTKLDRFFVVFLEGIVRTVESTPCECVSCRELDDLKLKIIVHSGRAVYHTIAGLAQVSGTDVILAHRLLKNTVPSREYLLMTEAAWEDLGREMEGEFTPGEEDCEGIGRVKTRVRLMGPDREKAREALYAKTPAELRSESFTYLKWMLVTSWRELFGTLRPPQVEARWPRNFALAWKMALRFTLLTPLLLVQVPRRLRARRDERLASARASS